MDKVTIIGAGMAGLGAAYHLKHHNVAAEIYEKQPFWGGHTASYEHNGGFIFDDGPHISFTKDKRMQDLFAENVGNDFQVIQTKVNNHWKGHWIKHPAIVNLHGLPEDLVIDILADFVDAQYKDPGEITNYDQWLRASYGNTFAEVYPNQYTIKYHTCEAKDMDVDWLGPRLYRPDIKEVLRSAVTPHTPDVHYIDNFRYPTHGGFQAYLTPFADLVPMHLDHKVVEIDPKSRLITFANGHQISYNRLVSSLPLPELIKVLKDVPQEVLEAASKLACSVCVLVNVGVNRENVSDNHWTYFYDHDYTFTRLSFPHKLSPKTVPEGMSSIQCECYYSHKYRPLTQDPNELIEPVIKDLIRCGLLREDDEIVHKNASVAPYANVIFDLDRRPALEVINGYLDELKIQRAGRYGEWNYSWTDESFKSGEAAAERALSLALV